MAFKIIPDTDLLDYIALYKNTSPPLDDTIIVGSATNRFKEIHAVSFQGTALEALYADIAERYLSDQLLEPGDVVRLATEDDVGYEGEPRDAEIVITTEDAERRVFGVISKAPAVLMNKDAGDNEKYPPVALVGRVYCKVIGPIRKGDPLLASDLPGVARAINDADAGVPSSAHVGTALQPYGGEDIGLIEIVVGR